MQLQASFLIKLAFLQKNYLGIMTTAANLSTIPEILHCLICKKNTYSRGWVRRRDMYATQSFMVLHSSGIIHTHIFGILSKCKQKQNITYKYKIYSYKHHSRLSLSFTLHHNNLFWCLHLLTNSDFLFNKFQLSRD